MKHPFHLLFFCTNNVVDYVDLGSILSTYLFKHPNSIFKYMYIYMKRPCFCDNKWLTLCGKCRFMVSRIALHWDLVLVTEVFLPGGTGLARPLLPIRQVYGSNDMYTHCVFAYNFSHIML